MMPLVVDKGFTKGWISTLTGAATISVTNDILKTTGTGSDQSLKEYWIPATPGQLVEVEITAKSNNGDPRITLDAVSYDGTFVQLDHLRVLKKDWQRYKLSAVLPYNSTHNFIRVTVGKLSSVTATTDGEFQDPIIKTDLGMGTPITIATGLILMNVGVPSLVSSYRSYGVDSLAYDAPSTTLTVTLSKKLVTGARPIVLVSGTNDHYFVPVAGGIVGGNPSSFKVKWSNGTSLVDVTATTCYVFFEVKM